MKKVSIVLAFTGAALMQGCGGGGGGGSTASQVAVASTALADTQVPAAARFTTFRNFNLSADRMLLAVGGFTGSGASPVYVSAWYVDANGTRQTVMFTKLATLQATPAGIGVQVGANVQAIQFDIYDASSSKSGEVAA